MRSHAGALPVCWLIAAVCLAHAGEGEEGGLAADSLAAVQLACELAVTPVYISADSMPQCGTQSRVHDWRLGHTTHVDREQLQQLLLPLPLPLLGVGCWLLLSAEGRMVQVKVARTMCLALLFRLVGSVCCWQSSPLVAPLCI